MIYRVTFHLLNGDAPEMEFDVAGAGAHLVPWIEDGLRDSPSFSGPGVYGGHHLSVRCDQVAWFQVQPSSTVGAF